MNRAHLIYIGIFTEGYMVPVRITQISGLVVSTDVHQEVVRIRRPVFERTVSEQKNRARWKALEQAKRRFPGKIISLDWE